MSGVIALVVALAPPAAAQPLGDDDFVRVAGGGFVVGARRFAFVGANLAVEHGEVERAGYLDTLAAARADGFTVGRVWALGEGDAHSEEWRRQFELFRLGPEVYVDEAYRQLDRVLAEARARGLRLILTLANHWDDYGGVGAYLGWAGLSRDGFGARDRFFSDERTRAFFRAHLERLVARVNHVTGVRYADDPAIFAWELMNESSVVSADGAAARRAWIAEMAGLLKQRDPHHLVTPGLIGYGSRAERAEWLAVCRLDAVDYCDSHLYPETTDTVDGPRRLAQLIDDRAELARLARKPIVFGEFGFQTTRPAFLGQPRARWFDRFLARAFYDGAAGALAWIYQPWTGHPRDFGIYVDRDGTDDVRAVLRRWAGRVRAEAPRARNPLLAAAPSDRPLYDVYVSRRGRARVTWRRDGDARVVELQPEAFSRARWERTGAWDGGALVHAYGAGDGWFEYRFATPAAAPSGRVALSLRLSSEWPGVSAPADGGSAVRVSLDGVHVATVNAVPDDGLGAPVEVPIASAALRRALAAGGRHLLRLEVVPGAAAHGLCVYGAPGRGADAAASAAAQPIRLTLAP